MRLLEVELYSPEPAALQEFYAGVLGLPTRPSPGGLTVQVGRTRLAFVTGPPLPGPYHLAFDVPERRFDAAYTWLKARTPLLGDGQTDRFFSHDWDAHMLYFTDPDGNILELIARHTRPQPPGDDPASPLLLHVSEVGLAVSDVPATLGQLGEALGLEGYQDGSDRFAPVGTPDGLLIVVARRRPWFPTAVLAEPLPVRLLIQSPRAGRLSFAEGPVQITGTGTLDPNLPSG